MSEPTVIGLVRWAGRVTRPGDVERHVAVEWPRRNGTPRVLVDGRKVNAKQRRRWLAMLAEQGVTRERVRAAVKAPGDDLRVAYSDDGS